MEEVSKICGKIKNIIFYSESTLFSVCSFNLYDLDEKEIIITGNFAKLEKDILYNLYGNYQEHQKYGMQFKVSKIEKILPNDDDSLIRYFSGPLFVGIGKKFATELVEFLGSELVEIIKENPDVLDTVPKINAKRKTAIINGVINVEESLDKTISFLNSHGLGIRNIMKIDKIYGDKALEIITNNPYSLVFDIDGIGFSTSDKLASALGFNPEDKKRLVAALLASVMDLCMRNKDTYCDYDELFNYFRKQIDQDSFNFDELISDLVARKMIVVVENRIYHHTQYNAEVFISEYLSEFPLFKLAQINDIDLKNGLDQFQNSINITYEQKQQAAILSFFSNDFSILTGGPGTGKTTITQAMVYLYKQLYPHNTIALCAPTGRAAQRMSELCNNECYTIHSLLKWDLEANTFGKNETDPLEIDCLIIDEFSMVDSYLFSNLLKASINVKKICIIGDEDQLPSVSCGCVLKDLIDTNFFNTIQLSTIFRQKEGSDVIDLAHKIKMNNFDEICFKGDVAFFECDKYQVKDVVLSILKQAIEKGYDITSIQMLASKYSGVAGIDNLNNLVQQYYNPYNPDLNSYKVGYKTYRENDKILQLKNQVSDGVFNGDIGILSQIIYPSEDVNNQIRFVVNFSGNYVEYTSENFHNITHAYCVSIHKSQGSEYPIVIIPIVSEASFMLQKRLLYTAITRAKKSLILVGNKQLFLSSLQKVDQLNRKTTLKQMLIEKFN